jgi:hypothetical protein
MTVGRHYYWNHRSYARGQFPAQKLSREGYLRLASIISSCQQKVKMTHNSYLVMNFALAKYYNGQSIGVRESKIAVLWTLRHMFAKILTSRQYIPILAPGLNMPDSFLWMYDDVHYVIL